MIVNHPKLGAVEIVCNRLNQIHLRAGGFTFNRVEYRAATLHVHWKDGKATTEYFDEHNRRNVASAYVSRMNLADVKWEQQQALETILLEIAQKFFDNKNNLVERWQGELNYAENNVSRCADRIDEKENELAVLRSQKEVFDQLVVEAQYRVEKNTIKA